MIKKVSFVATLFFGLVIFNSLWGQAKPQITNMSLDIKQNGAFIQLRSNLVIDKQDITGWVADNGWFYLTVYNAVSDTIALTKTNYSYPITNIEAINTDESTQISFQIAQEIETFEFYQSTNPPEILLSLRFPVGELIEDFAEHPKPIIAPTPKKRIESPYYKRFRTALYIVGTSLTLAGILEQDNKDASSWELISGITLIGSTYIYDQYIRPKLFKKKSK